MLVQMWKELGRGARVGLVLAATLIGAATLAVAGWLLRTDYQVLFADLSPQDAGAMVAELDRMKVPYKLGAGGSAILVDAEAVHKTRIRLMAKDLPLHGTVGFELFNNADFGMTEFAQKINYQRALQGEITRTILSLSEIESARVHLVLPEEGVFRRAGGKAKAAITLAMKRGQVLQADQVAGIQRLVSAAVPSILLQDVTIVDEHGVALTRPAGDAADQAGTARLELKRETESYLSRKAQALMEQAVGAGQAVTSVDVTLNMDQVRITTDEPTGTQVRAGQSPSGVVLRERESSHDGGTEPRGAGGGEHQHEVEYQAGRRVQQVVGVPGAIAQIRVVAVVHKALDPQLQMHLQELLFAAVGASHERGDVVVVQFEEPVSKAAAPESASAAPISAPPAAPKVDTDRAIWILALCAALVAGAGIGMVWPRRRPAAKALSAPERQAALAQVQAWLGQDAVASRERSAWKQ